MRKAAVCARCGRRIVAFHKQWRRMVKPPVDHDFCEKCWKAERDRIRPLKSEKEKR